MDNDNETATASNEPQEGSSYGVESATLGEAIETSPQAGEVNG